MNRLDLGVGITYFPPWEAHLGSIGDEVDVIEIEPQTFCWQTEDASDPYVLDPDAMARINAFPQPKLVHGVSSPVGTSGLPDPAGVRLLAQAARTVDARLASEHLSFNRTSRDGGMSFAGFLLPGRQTRAGVEAAVEGARSIASAVGPGVPFSVETGANYLRARRDELRDGEFVAAVAEGADCGILLDLHNIWANERNGRQRVDDFVADLPMERVREVHVAGGFQFGGYYVDSHSGLVAEPLLDIAARILPWLPELRAVLLEVMPEYVAKLDPGAVRAQLQRLRTLAERRPVRRARPSPPPPSQPVSSGPSPGEWEDALGDLAAGTDPATEADIASLAADPAIPMLQALVGIARAGRITDGLRLAIRASLLLSGPEETQGLLDRYIAATRPKLWGSAESTQFATWLAAEDGVPALVRDVAAVEAGAIAATRGNRTVEVLTTHEPWATMAALGEGRLPETAPPGDYRVEITP